jgi:hypothetical protein
VPTATQDPHAHGSQPKVPQRGCPGCGATVTPETKHGRYCSRSCALKSGCQKSRQTARLARALESDEYLTERLDWAIHDVLDRVLMLSIGPAVEDILPRALPTALPNVLQDLLPNLLPECLTTGTLKDALHPLVTSEVEKALAGEASAPQAPQAPDPVAKPESAKASSINRTAQQAALERLEEAVRHRLRGLPHDWRRVIAVRDPGGTVRVEVTF